MTTLIKNGFLVDSTQNFLGDIPYDILIKDKKIAKIGNNINTDNIIIDTTIDATGLHVMPGLIDIHVHLREPGYTHKEDILSGTTAAVHGGITSILCMPNTNPVIDNKETIDHINNANKLCHVYICGTISKSMKSEKLSDFDMYTSLNIKAISDDGKPVPSAKLMQSAIVEARKNNFLIISHCEDEDIIDGGIINKGEISKKLGIKGMDISSEDIITAREIFLANAEDSPIHIAHVSSKTSTNLIRYAKSQNIKVTAETCPHYFIYDENKLLNLDANYRMNPPLRTATDVAAIIEGIVDGTFDCIVTDHAPHTEDEKSDFYNSPNGVIGMETSFSAAYTHLVKTNIIPLHKLVDLMSKNPAKLLNINAGTLNVDTPADIAVFNLSASFTVDKNNLHGKSKNMIFHGETFYGKNVCTIVDGDIKN